MATTIPQDIKSVVEEVSVADTPIRYRIIAASLLAVLALFSALVLSDTLSSPETYQSTIISLDEKKETVIALTTVTAGASAAVSALPDDTCTPISEKLSDLSMCFFVALSAICLEKYMLTTCGFVTFAFIVPLSCILAIMALFVGEQCGCIRKRIASISVKLLAFGIAFTLTVPTSMFISDRIEDTYQDSINATIESAETATETVESAEEEPQREEPSNPIEFVSNLFQDIGQAADDAVNTVGNALEQMKTAIVKLFEAAAVMLVISCAIPILVMVFLIWTAKQLMGINIDIPARLANTRTSRLVSR